MSTTRILTIVFALISIGLGYGLYDSIFSRIALEERIQSVESRIISKLEMIREAQVAYQSVNGQYTSDWDKLLNFVDSGYLYLVSKREIVVPLDYGADSVWIEIDTLGSVSVRESIFNNANYPNFDFESLPYIPEGAGKKFEMWADKIDKAGVKVDVVEVKNVVPVDPRRNEKNDLTTQKPLRFGSRENVTLSGNWE